MNTLTRKHLMQVGLVTAMAWPMVALYELGYKLLICTPMSWDSKVALVLALVTILSEYSVVPRIIRLIDQMQSTQ